MLEFVYKLNLPMLQEVITPSFNKNFFYFYNHLDIGPINNEINNKFKNICGVNFQNRMVVCKNNSIGLIHNDTTDDEIVWGINWVYNGICLMEYWLDDPKFLNAQFIKPNLKNNTFYRKYDDLLNKKSLKMYIMPPGAYLVNASVIHRPSAVGKRLVYIIRPITEKNITWNDVVEKFQSLILGIPDIKTYS